MATDRPKLHMPIRTPGNPPAVQPEDDLEGLEEGGRLPDVDPVQAQLAEMAAEIKRLKRGSKAEPSKPSIREPEMSEAEAEKHCAELVSQGIRPRAILTPSGWWTHRELARGPGSLGNASAPKA